MQNLMNHLQLSLFFYKSITEITVNSFQLAGSLIVLALKTKIIKEVGLQIQPTTATYKSE